MPLNTAAVIATPGYEDKYRSQRKRISLTPPSNQLTSIVLEVTMYIPLLMERAVTGFAHQLSKTSQS
jgi:hypothetical protein